MVSFRSVFFKLHIQSYICHRFQGWQCGSKIQSHAMMLAGTFCVHPMCVWEPHCHPKQVDMRCSQIKKATVVRDWWYGTYIDMC